jgi:DnaK suppressor protein
MEQADMQRIERVLRAMLENSEHTLGRRDEIAIESAPDTIDRVQLAEEREIAIRQIEFGFSQMRNIKTAIERIHDGSYGTCLGCESDISPKRLAAVPWTMYCIGCQDKLDRERAEPEDEEFFPHLRHARRVA